MIIICLSVVIYTSLKSIRPQAYFKEFTTITKNQHDIINYLFMKNITIYTSSTRGGCIFISRSKKKIKTEILNKVQ